MVSDYVCVGCQGFREALSARLDGEPAPVAPEDLDAHLRACPDCRRWGDEAAAVTRSARTGPVAGAVDVTGAVLHAAPGRWRGRVAATLRLLLGAVGAAQLILGLLQATTLRPGGHNHHGATTMEGASAGHLWHESVAWNLAVGAAFLWVASRRHRSAVLVPIMTVFVGALLALSVVDTLAGRVEATRLASHAFVLAGYALVLAMSRRPSEPDSGDPRPDGAQPAGSETEPGGPAGRSPAAVRHRPTAA